VVALVASSQIHYALIGVVRQECGPLSGPNADA
jgi:hypothetical protein